MAENPAESHPQPHGGGASRRSEERRHPEAPLPQPGKRGLDPRECRAVLSATEGYLFVTDEARRIQFMNRAPLGRGLGELIGKDAALFVAEGHRAAFLNALDRIISGESRAELELRGAETDHWYAVTVTGVRELTEHRGFAIHALDNSQAKQSESERARLQALLQEREAPARAERVDDQRRFGVMADALPILISYVDGDRRYQYNNAAYERWFGTSRHEMRGRRLDEVLGESAYESVRAYVDAALSGTAVSFEMTIPYKDAGTRRVIARYVPDVTSEGEVAGFFALVEDISRRKEAEDALRQREDELRQLQKMEALGLLAGSIAHDFNNLLQTVVAGSAAAARAAGEQPGVAEPIARVRAAAERGISMTRRLLSFSRRSELEPRPVDLDELVDDLASLLGRLLDARIEFKVELGAHCRIFADAAELQQILMNLVINARDAMPDGGTLRIETALSELGPQEAARHQSMKPNHYALVTVSDTGTGMDEHTRARIFDPYFTTKSPTGGTGLGLSTVYGLVKHAGGHIDVDTAPGRGTSFVLYFPALGADSEADEASGAEGGE